LAKSGKISRDFRKVIPRFLAELFSCPAGCDTLAFNSHSFPIRADILLSPTNTAIGAHAGNDFFAEKNL
jgi:hypothetical protein